MIRTLLAAGAALVSTGASGEDPRPPQGSSLPPLSLVGEYPGPDGGYDYLSIDPSGRLFAAREYGVMAVDLDSGKVTERLVEANDVSAVLPIPGSSEMLSTVYGDDQALLFDRRSGAEIARIDVGDKPDAAVHDPASGLVFVMNAGTAGTSLIDVARREKVGDIALGGKPEAGVADGRGRLFVNIEDRAEIAVIDVNGRRVLRRYALPGCIEPTGLAYDAKSATLISACHNGIAKLIDATSGADRGTVAVGRNADGAIFDDHRRLVVIPAKEGTLTVFPLDTEGRAGTRQTVPTRYGARTAALDPRSGRIYLSAPRFTRDGGDEEVAVPGTFRIIAMGVK